MAQELADLYGGNRERRAPVDHVGFIDGDGGNVIAAFAADGSFLFDFAWRPHKPSPETNHYTEEGLFLC